MERLYDVRVAGLTVGEKTKWIDNVLSHYSVIGVEQGTRGVGRRLSRDALVALTLCKMLTRELGVPLEGAVSLANRIVGSRADRVTHQVAPGIDLEVSVVNVERAMLSRLADAIESVVSVRRGRPSLNRPGDE